MNESLAEQRLILLGASTRAAADSARRAGYVPFCADLFADADLAACCHVMKIQWSEYPEGLARAAAELPAGPWLYTGALENSPDLVGSIAAKRPLWGNDADVLRRVRDPFAVAQCLKKAGLECPTVRRADEEIPPGDAWLLKPFRGAGGRGVRRYSVLGTRYSGADDPGAPHSDYFLQQHIAGVPWSAVFVAAGRRAALAGVTRQLVGEVELHAKPFHYCGSLGPLTLDRKLAEQFSQLGDVLAAEFNLVGLFGVDGIIARGVFWPVEINPRYTASVEVLELALGLPIIGLHRDACERGAIPFGEFAESYAGSCDATRRPRDMLGKAILFAPSDIVVPDLTRWLSAHDRNFGRWPVPRIADVPHAGEHIAAGQPICTVFAAEDSIAACRRALVDSARKLCDELSPSRRAEHASQPHHG